MNTHNILLKRPLTYGLFVCTCVVSLLLSAQHVALANTDTAIDYLKNSPDSPWATMALSAASETADVSFLKTVSADTAIELEAPILALVAADKSPRTYPETDLVAELLSHHRNDQLGDPSLLNDDIFGLLALRAAEISAGEQALVDAKDFILEHQNSDGGFPFSAGGTSDTNTTAAAIQALLEAGVSTEHTSITDAFAYLRAAQNDDGGFPYDPKSQYGTDSDASSSAWVLMALYKAGVDPADWQKNGTSPLEHLLSLQTSGGYFEHQPGAGENSFTPVTTSYALIALSDEALPIEGGALKKEEPEEEPSVPEVEFTIDGSTGTLCAGEVVADTALAVVESAASDCGFTYEIEDTAYGPYLSRIGSDEASGSEGWLYTVNGTAPTVGAGEYTLENSDTVRWYFSGFEEEPEENATGTSQSISLSAELRLETEEPDTGDTIGFSIEPGTLDFGVVHPDSEHSRELSIKNTGEVPIAIESTVSGGGLFREFLTLGTELWRNWTAHIDRNATETVPATLSIPASYQTEGQQSGDLIFWAYASE